jgi:hypothetical protein
VRTPIAALALLCASAVNAQQPNCGERAKIIYPLANQYLEAPLLKAIDEAGNLVEWWGNPATGTWTMLSTKPGGPTCAIKAGEGFSIVPLDPGGDPA